MEVFCVSIPYIWRLDDTIRYLTLIFSSVPDEKKLREGLQGMAKEEYATMQRNPDGGPFLHQAEMCLESLQHLAYYPALRGTETFQQAPCEIPGFGTHFLTMTKQSVLS